VILAGDVGGTKADFALFERRGSGPPVELRHARIATEGWPALEPLVERFVGPDVGRLAAAAIGVAGPVREGRVTGTNLPWTVEARHLAERLGLPTLTLMNDLEATAHGLATLGPDETRVLHPGQADPEGTVCVLAAGTGLGQSFLIREPADPGRAGEPALLCVRASEGGHADYAPRTPLEWELAQWLAARYDGHASWERVLSGPGLGNLYEFLRDTGRAEEPAWLAAERREGDPNAAIAEADGKCALATRAIDLFVEAYAAQAGNLALTYLATGGVYLAGGIAPRLAARLSDGRFARAYVAKGRLSSLVASIPVRLVLNDRAALLGAAAVAFRAARARGIPHA
jgi:glucokinase